MVRGGERTKEIQFARRRQHLFLQRGNPCHRADTAWRRRRVLQVALGG